MEPYLLQMFASFLVGLIAGVIVMLVVNKLKSGNISAAGVKKEYQDYQDRVEEHFEATSKKFQDMTEQYQDLYKHLSVGATSLCRPDSVAATLADGSDATLKLEKDQKADQPAKEVKGESKEKAPVDSTAKEVKPETKAEPKPTDNKPVEKSPVEKSPVEKKPVEKKPVEKSAPKESANTDKKSETKKEPQKAATDSKTK